MKGKHNKIWYGGLALLLMCSLVFTAAACGKKKENEPKEPTAEDTVQAGDEVQTGEDEEDPAPEGTEDGKTEEGASGTEEPSDPEEKPETEETSGQDGSAGTDGDAEDSAEQGGDAGKKPEAGSEGSPEGTEAGKEDKKPGEKENSGTTQTGSGNSGVKTEKPAGQTDSGKGTKPADTNKPGKGTTPDKATKPGKNEGTKPAEKEKNPDKETKPEKTVLDGSLEEIMEAVYKNVKSELPMLANTVITQENAEYYLGTADLEFEEALSSDAMIISTPFSVCLVRLPEGADVEAAKKKIVESVNPYKWICVGVEPKNVLVGSVDRVILLTMTGNSQEIMDSFLSLQKKGKKAEVLSQAVSPDQDGLLFFQDYCAKALKDDGGKSAAKLGQKIESIYSQYLKGQKNVYYSVIPDKSYFIPNTAMSTDAYFNMLGALQDNVKNASYISINYNLSLSDYFKTDLHWRQEALFPVVSELGTAMGFSVSESDFKKNTLKSYKGIYASNYSKAPYEELSYMTSKATEEAKVSVYDKGEQTGVYFLKEWKGKVPYNLFLGGPNPLVTITNPSVKNGKELIIFGDSFMSSLAPLLTGAYEKITLVDLRFVMSSHLSEVMEFNGQDVLFLYNMAVVNNSALLK